jgi:hypothetical protein
MLVYIFDKVLHGFQITHKQVQINEIMQEFDQANTVRTSSCTGYTIYDTRKNLNIAYLVARKSISSLNM